MSKEIIPSSNWEKDYKEAEVLHWGKPQTELEKRWECLNPLLRGYLSLSYSLQDHSLTSNAKAVIRTSFEELRDLLVKEPGLQAELANFITFRDKRK